MDCKKKSPRIKMVLDGRTRQRACLIAGIEPEYIEYEGDTSPDGLLRFVLSKNVSRRHLTTSQKALLADRMTRERNGDPPVGGFTQVEAGKIIGVSEREIQRAAQLRREASPELIAGGEWGKITIHAALRSLPLQKGKVFNSTIMRWSLHNSTRLTEQSSQE